MNFTVPHCAVSAMSNTHHVGQFVQMFLIKNQSWRGAELNQRSRREHQNIASPRGSHDHGWVAKVLVYQGVVDGETCRRATQLLEASGDSGTHLFEEWRLGRDPVTW